MTPTQSSAISRPLGIALSAALAMGAVFPAVAASAGAQPARDAGRIQRPDASDPSRGNWMREYVQLRLAERNLAAAEGQALTEEEIDGLVQPMIVGGSVAGASDNPFYTQFRDVVATALRTSIRFPNRQEGRTASLPAHRAVLAAIEAGDARAAGEAMAAIIADVMGLIADAEGGG